MPPNRKGFARDALTGAFLHAGGAEAVLSLWVDVHLVGSGVVEHEWRAGVLTRGFIPELAADLFTGGTRMGQAGEDAQHRASSVQKAQVVLLNVQEFD